ncbi:Hypothetical predicted protein [Paramuricea clavata]|uniref:Uncharacterized protein n=1 Tax=Paramuricea clavata TaxID=317549 RepID=A0A6S7I4V8_PARCT|nr:Hypothetical predicted protein [Paramuricea clavata]
MWYGKKPISDKAAPNESDSKNGSVPVKNGEIHQDIKGEIQKESVMVESSKDK